MKTEEALRMIIKEKFGDLTKEELIELLEIVKKIMKKKKLAS